jgi:hypothetical protein
MVEFPETPDEELFKGGSTPKKPRVPEIGLDEHGMGPDCDRMGQGAH